MQFNQFEIRQVWSEIFFSQATPGKTMNCTACKNLHWINNRVIIPDIFMAFLFKCFSIYIYYTMEREGPISYSDCVNYYEFLLSIHRTCSFVYIIINASTVHAFHQ